MFGVSIGDCGCCKSCDDDDQLETENVLEGATVCCTGFDAWSGSFGPTVGGHVLYHQGGDVWSTFSDEPSEDNPYVHDCGSGLTEEYDLVLDITRAPEHITLQSRAVRSFCATTAFARWEKEPDGFRCKGPNLFVLKESRDLRAPGDLKSKVCIYPVQTLPVAFSTQCGVYSPTENGVDRDPEDYVQLPVEWTVDAQGWEGYCSSSALDRGIYFGDFHNTLTRTVFGFPPTCIDSNLEADISCNVGNMVLRWAGDGFDPPNAEIQYLCSLPGQGCVGFWQSDWHYAGSVTDTALGESRYAWLGASAVLTCSIVGGFEFGIPVTREYHVMDFHWGQVWSDTSTLPTDLANGQQPYFSNGQRVYLNVFSSAAFSSLSGSVGEFSRDEIMCWLYKCHTPPEQWDIHECSNPFAFGRDCELPDRKMPNHDDLEFCPVPGVIAQNNFPANCSNLLPPPNPGPCT